MVASGDDKKWQSKLHLPSVFKISLEQQAGGSHVPWAFVPQLPCVNVLCAIEYGDPNKFFKVQYVTTRIGTLNLWSDGELTVAYISRIQWAYLDVVADTVGAVEGAASIRYGGRTGIQGCVLPVVSVVVSGC